MIRKIERPNSGGLALVKKSGNKHFLKMNKIRWEKYRKDKKLWEKNQKKQKD